MHVEENKLNKGVQHGQLGEILTRQATLEDNRVEDFEEQRQSSWRGDHEKL